MLKRTSLKRPEAFLLGLLGTEILKDQIKLFMYTTTATRISLAQRLKDGTTVGRSIMAFWHIMGHSKSEG